MKIYCFPRFLSGRIFVFLALLLNYSGITAQITIRGLVTNQKNEAVPYVNISIYGTYEGTVSNDSGRFEMKTRLTGNIRLGASCIGMESSFIEIDSGETDQQVTFILREAYASLSPVTITAGTFAAGEQGKAELLKPRDMGTTAGSPGDIQATLETLPGTQRIGYTEGLFVRGGSGRESQYYMDGLIYPNPYYSHVPSLKQRGRLDPYLFSGTVFSAGGYSAQYGQALSSVLLLNSKGLADSTLTGGGIHSYGGNLFHTHRWKTTSLHVNANYNNLSVYHSLSRGNTQWTRSPLNRELRMILRFKPNKNGMLKIYADGSDTRVGIRLRQEDESGPQDFKVKNTNILLNVNYMHFFNNNKSSLYLGASTSKNSDKINFSASSPRQSDFLSQGKAVYKYAFTNDIHFIAGGEYMQTRLYGKADALESSVHDHLVSLFAESEATFREKFALRLGLRSEFSKYTGTSNLVPRTSFAYKFTKSSQVSFSYGIFSQLPDKTDMLYNPEGLSAERASHFIVNYQYQWQDRTLRIELYSKQYKNLVTGYSPQFNYPGRAGYSKGFEVFFRDRTSIPNFDGWISYSYTDCKRATIVAGEMVTPDYISAHSIALVGKYWNPFAGILFSSSFLYATPRNYVYQTGDGNRISLKVPYYSTLDISVSKPMKLFRLPAMFFLSWQNILGYDQLLGYLDLPVFEEPLKVYRSEKRSFFIGLFISMYND